MHNTTTRVWTPGVQNRFKDEDIPRGAASDALNWVSRDDRIELRRGSYIFGQEETSNGSVKGYIISHRVDGTAVHFEKVSTKIRYYNSSSDTWTDVITGLTESAEYTFAEYTSLAGSFVFACGVDGLFKIPTANPASYIDLTDDTKNYKGKITISDARMFCWDIPTDRTGLYLSYIDSLNYTTVSGESLGTGNASDQTFAGTLAFKAAGSTRSCFGVAVAAGVVAAVSISGISQATSAVVTTSAAHGLTVGDTVIFWGVSGMTEINGLFGTVTAVGGGTQFTVGIDSSGFTGYSSGGSMSECELFTDDLSGNLTSAAGGTGTINYATGAISVTFNGTPVTGTPVSAEYQWEDSNNGGLGDFTYSSPRTAGQGDVFRQDVGGDKIMNVLVWDGKYYSIKASSVYELDLTADDTNATNKIFRRDIGCPFFRAAISTSRGLVLLDTANPEEPRLARLEQNLTGDNLVASNLAPQFDFSKYTWDNTTLSTYGEYIIFNGKSAGATSNDRLFLFNARLGSVDILDFNTTTLEAENGLLYAGDSLSDSVSVILNGFDDNDFDIYNNKWESKQDDLDIEELKRIRRIILRGQISVAQSFDVYVSLDRDNYQYVGSVSGDGAYVNKGKAYTIGSNMIGTAEIGGGGSDIVAYDYVREIPLRLARFQLRKIKFVATGIGYVSVDYQQDNDAILSGWGQRIPKKYRQTPS